MEPKSLHSSHQQVNRKWGALIPQAYCVPAGGGDLLPQGPTGGTFRRQAGFTGDRLGKLAKETLGYKKSGRALIPPTQPPYPPPQALNPSWPLRTSGQTTIFYRQQG